MAPQESLFFLFFSSLSMKLSPPYFIYARSAPPLFPVQPFFYSSFLTLSFSSVLPWLHLLSIFLLFLLFPPSPLTCISVLCCLLPFLLFIYFFAYSFFTVLIYSLPKRLHVSLCVLSDFQPFPCSPKPFHFPFLTSSFLT